jgi:hypothetical protein
LEFLGCVIDAKYACALSSSRADFSHIANIFRTMLTSSHGNVCIMEL